MIYLQESDFDIGTSKYLVLFSHAMKSNDSNNWIKIIIEELKSIDQKKILDLVELLEGYKKVGCKWVF